MGFSVACVASSKVEFRYLQQGGVFSGVCSEQQGGVLLSQTVGFSVVCVASSKVEFCYLKQGGVFSGVCSEQQGGVPLSQTVGFFIDECSEQQGGVPLSQTGWGFQWHVSGARYSMRHLLNSKIDFEFIISVIAFTFRIITTTYYRWHQLYHLVEKRSRVKIVYTQC